MKKLITLLLTSVSLFGQSKLSVNETPESLIYESPVIDDQAIKNFQTYLVLPLPAVGCSFRWDKSAVDVTAGLLGVDCTYSKMFYFHKDPGLREGFYGSVGAGAGIGTFPNYYIFEWGVFPKIIAPVRFGYEGKRGFFDVGVSFTYMKGNWYYDELKAPLPLPEIRGGINF